MVGPQAALSRPLAWRLVAAGLLLALTLAGSWHTRTASFFLDDHLIDAIASQLDNPLTALWQRHFFTEHLHRPLGFVSWWLLAHAGPGAGVQLLGNMVLLALAGTLLFELMRRWGVPAAAGLALSALWLAHPGTLVFASWGANRFELLATSFELACLIAWTAYLQGRRAGALALALALALAALLSKESAVLLAILVPLLTWIHPGSGDQSGPSPRLKVATTGMVAVLMAGYAGYRQALGLRLPPEVLEGGRGMAWLGGIVRWWANLPSFLLDGLTTPPVLGAVLLAMATGGGLAALAWIAWRQHQSRPVTGAMPLAAGVATLLTMPVLQSGHLSFATLVFVDAGGQMTGLFAERFYFQALMGVALIAAWVSTTLRRPLSRASTVGLAVLLAAVLAQRCHASLAMTRDWPRTTQHVNGLAQAAADAMVEARAFEQVRCRVRFTQSGSPVFMAFAEPIVKAVAGPASAIGRCIIETESAPEISMTHESRLAEHPLRWPIADLPRVGPWYFLRAVFSGPPTSPITHAFRYDPAARRFVPGPP